MKIYSICPRYDFCSYGPKGGVIIQAMLLRMYNPTTTPTDAFAPLSLAMFTQCFLVPFIACLLIAADMDCSTETAREEMANSSDLGESLYGADDEDDDIDDILKTINSRRGTRNRALNKVCFLNGLFNY